MISKPYAAAELRQQEQIIRRVLETGTPEELAKLEEARTASDLHPQISELIRSCLSEVEFIDACGGRVSLQGKPENTIDLDVARAAKEAGESVEEFIEIDQVIQDALRVQDR